MKKIILSVVLFTTAIALAMRWEKLLVRLESVSMFFKDQLYAITQLFHVENNTVFMLFTILVLILCIIIRCRRG